MLAPGTLLQDRYRIVAQIAKGGMGAVYQARDLRLSNDVALKETLFTDDTYRRAFEHEAKLLARLRHQALPRVIDHFIEGQGQFLVMEFIHGEDLGNQLSRLGKRFATPQTMPTVLRWADQLLDVLHYLHTRSSPIYHRDIKPRNLKLTSNFDIILLDFGLARGGATFSVDDKDTTTPEVASQKIYGFTPPYAPIEQMRDGEPDPRSDLYSLAATLYHMITGTLPADAMGRMARLINNQPDSLRPIREISPHVPEPIANLIQRAMSVTLEGRPRTAREMHEEFNLARGLYKSPNAELRPQSTVTPPLPANGSSASTGSVTPSHPGGITPTSDSRQPNTALPLGTLLHTLTTGSPIRSLAFSPKGDVLVAGYENHVAEVWKVGDFSSLVTLKGHTSGVRSVAITPANDLLVTGSDDESVRLWQMSNGALRRHMHVRGCSIESLAFSPNGRLLAIGGWGNVITLCELEGDYLSVLNTLPCPFVHSLSFNAKGDLLAAGCYDGAIYLWDTNDHHQLEQISGFSSFIYSVAFSPNGEQIAASSQNNVGIWRMSDMVQVETLKGHSGPVRSIGFNPRGGTIASASEDRSVRIWRLSDGAAAMPHLEHRAGVATLAYSPDGTLLATGTHDGRIHIWKIA